MPAKKDETANLPLLCPRCNSNAHYTPDKKLECEECGIVG